MITVGLGQDPAQLGSYPKGRKYCFSTHAQRHTQTKAPKKDTISYSIVDPLGMYPAAKPCRMRFVNSDLSPRAMQLPEATGINV